VTSRDSQEADIRPQTCILSAVTQRFFHAFKIFSRCSIMVGLATPAFVGCVGHGRPYPLYPNPEVRLEPAKVARLTGIVATVDGVDVAGHGDAFELAPGCHVVTLLKKLGEVGEHDPWSVDVPRNVYAFKMTGGHVYAIEHRVQMGSDRNGTVRVSAIERDGHGAIIGPVAPSRGAQDIEECKQWEQAQQPKAQQP